MKEAIQEVASRELQESNELRIEKRMMRMALEDRTRKESGTTEEFLGIVAGAAGRLVDRTVNCSVM